MPSTPGPVMRSTPLTSLAVPVSNIRNANTASAACAVERTRLACSRSSAVAWAATRGVSAERVRTVLWTSCEVFSEHDTTEYSESRQLTLRRPRTRFWSVRLVVDSSVTARRVSSWSMMRTLREARKSPRAPSISFLMSAGLVLLRNLSLRAPGA